ncbi:MAG: hypothetical protein M3N16_01450 [Actinomycetota bacterium]|nr:hypothetical protein [Actinomycetota bacterium]
MTTTEHCRCGCCGPVEDTTEPRTDAASERERLEAEQRSAEARVSELMEELDRLDPAAR